METQHFPMYRIICVLCGSENKCQLVSEITLVIIMIHTFSVMPELNF